MAIAPRDGVRRLVLGGSWLVFLAVAACTLVAPRAVAAQYGYALSGVDSFNEFRAIFFGFWLALAGLLFTAARRLELKVLSDLAALALLAQASGRAVSFLLDGVPTARFVGAFAIELVSGALLVWLRFAPVRDASGAQGSGAG